ncbi:MAG: hypothetical protein BWY15_00823 [Firmicutes bacterium ADurb.Bin193]|nr:MAG: hypothetical protein BWY15_00823 [Firmicutes bacterium ADurb.Bin193]
MTTLTELYELASEEDITIADVRLPKTKSLSAMEDGKCYIGIDPKEIDCSACEKERLAHEIGHCVQGAFYNIYSPYDIKSRHEYRANRWAYKKLVPLEEVKKANAIGLKETWELAEYFNVPCDFMCKALEFYNNVRPME